MSSFRNRGFSFLEALVALVVIALAIILALGILPISRMAIAKARNMHLASVVAREKLEEWRRNGYDWIATQPSCDLKTDSFLVCSGIVNIQTSLSQTTVSTKLHWRITHKPVIYGDIEAVDVRMTWNEQNGPWPEIHELSLGSWVAR